MQPPVQCLCYYHSPHADVGMDLRINNNNNNNNDNSMCQPGLGARGASLARQADMF